MASLATKRDLGGNVRRARWRRWAVAMSVVVHGIAAAALWHWHLPRGISRSGTPDVLDYEVAWEPPPPPLQASLPTIAAPKGIPLVLAAVETEPEPPPHLGIATPANVRLVAAESKPQSDRGRPVAENPPSASPLREFTRGGGLAGRRPENRGAWAAKLGGTERSESAVESALRWLAAHQREDGSWRFDHTTNQCQGKCTEKGFAATATGATGLALLPFLGADHTHVSGEYRAPVAAGLAYLKRRQVRTPHGGDLQDGTMYAHGIATIALCEALAMTGDESLREPAQQAVDFLVAAQHEGGGWRYYPKQPGDTTVFGWQFMALRSADLAELDVPSSAIEKAVQYLDGVEAADGSGFGYQHPGSDRTPSAIGYLSRMYLGWSPIDPQFARGVAKIKEWGPSPIDVYFNFYATQVFHHRGGEDWERWNETLRDHLVQTQAREGHARGSWFFSQDHAYAGGRLYTTALSALTLEVYYRHLPLYGEESVGTAE